MCKKNNIVFESDFGLTIQIMSQVQLDLQVEQADWNEAQGTLYTIYRECHWAGSMIWGFSITSETLNIFLRKKSEKALKSPLLLPKNVSQNKKILYAKAKRTIKQSKNSIWGLDKTWGRPWPTGG